MANRYAYLTEASPKTVKGELLNFLTGILYLAPFKSSGIANVCPFASIGCVATCLNTAGRAGIMKKGATTNAIQEARKRRTAAFFRDRRAFIDELYRDVSKLQKRAARLGMRPAVRLNGTSDLRFDIFARDLFDAFPDVQWYDYTKDPNKLRDYVNGKTPANYHVTFSWSENASITDLRLAQESGVNIAVPYIGDASRIVASLPVRLLERGVIDGDAHDLRFLDPADGAIVALTAKGKAKRDQSGFVVRT